MSTDSSTQRQLGDYGPDHQQLATEVGRADDPNTVDLTQQCVECPRRLSGKLARGDDDRCAFCRPMEGDDDE